MIRFRSGAWIVGSDPVVKKRLCSAVKMGDSIRFSARQANWLKVLELTGSVAARS